MPKFGDRCANCEFFEPPPEKPKNIDLARDLSGKYSKGSCFRFPTFVPHKPDDLCGEHSNLLRMRTERHAR